VFGPACLLFWLQFGGPDLSPCWFWFSLSSFFRSSTSFSDCVYFSWPCKSQTFPTDGVPALFLFGILLTRGDSNGFCSIFYTIYRNTKTIRPTMIWFALLFFLAVASRFFQYSLNFTFQIYRIYQDSYLILNCLSRSCLLHFLLLLVLFLYFHSHKPLFYFYRWILIRIIIALILFADKHPGGIAFPDPYFINGLMLLGLTQYR